MASTTKQADLAAALAIEKTAPKPSSGYRHLTPAEVAQAAADYRAMMATADRVQLAAPDMNGKLVPCGKAYVFGGKRDATDLKKAA